MIRWEPGAVWPKTERNQALDCSLIEWMWRLGDTLTWLDAADPDTDSMTWDEATDHVITSAREVVAAAAPILQDPDAFAGVFQTATESLRDQGAWCRDCERAEGPLCGDHAADLARADTYDTVRAILIGRARSSP